MFVCPECGAAQPVAGACPADRNPMLPIGDDLLLGTTIGAYRVACLLGIGGMGRVYKGVHPTIGSRVAIKVLSRECSDRRDLVDRFFAEARAVNVIRHEGIVNVLDLAVLPDGRPYIIMEYVDGAPLANLIGGAPLPLGGLARLAVEVLDALGAAHAKGIVHRDLKPDNIFVTPGGRPKVLDFGIAKLTDMGSLNSATRTGSLLGTPHYMSPEQAAGRPVDLRADIYAMGVILFECATGQRPFSAESLFDLLTQHVQAPPPSPRALRPDMPPAMESVILTALGKAPDQRFGSAAAMSMALQQATAQLPPEQWTPISGAARTAPGGWTPSQPPSWSSHPPSQQMIHPPSQQLGPPPQQQPPQTTPTTVSAGQVTAKKSSKRGVWLALLAVVLIGGGVTAGVLVAGGGGDAAPAPAKVAEKPGDKPGDKPSDKPADKPAEREASPKGDKPAEREAPAKADKHGGDDPSEKDEDDLGLAEAAFDDMTKEFEGLGLDDAQVKQIQAIKKLPASQRVAALQKLAPQIAASLAGGVGAPAKPPGGATGWVVNGPLDAGPWDPKHVDVAALIAFAIKTAKATVPDAQLERISADGVYPDGHADLTLPAFSATGEIELRFVSPSHKKKDPKVPLGVPQPLTCEFRVEADPQGVSIRSINGMGCNEPPIPTPRCSPAQIWQRMLVKHAELKGVNAVANLSIYNFSGKKGRWYFSIRDGSSETFDDDC